MSQTRPTTNRLAFIRLAIFLTWLWPTVTLAGGLSSFTLNGYEGLPLDVGGSWFVQTRDFDKDGDLDLFVGRSFQTDQVLLNDGRGHFTWLPENSAWYTPGGSYDAVWLDVNNDGREDLILARGPESGGTSVHPGRDQILLLEADGGFREATGNLPGGELTLFGLSDTLNFSMGIASGDFNKDGIPDLVLANGGVEYLIRIGLFRSLNLLIADKLLANDLYLGGADSDGDGVMNFSDASNSSGLGQRADLSTDVAVGDFNRDGFDDIFVTNYYDARIHLGINLIASPDLPDSAFVNKLYLNDPDNPGQFRWAVENLPYELLPSTSVSAADFDGDDDLDLFITNDDRAEGRSGVAASKLYVNDGSGRFRDAGAELLPDFDQLYLAAFDGQFVDVNKDNRLDIFAAGSWSFLFLQSPDGGFTDATAALPQHPASGRPHTFHSFGAAVADFDGDERVDIVLANTYEQNRLHVQVDGLRFVDTTSTNLPPDGENTSTVAISDLNDDGRPDVLALGPTKPNTHKLYLNRGPGSKGFSRFDDRSDLLALPISNNHGMAIADVNRDERPDLLISGYEGGRLYYHAGLDEHGAPRFVDSTARWMPELISMTALNRAQFIDLNSDGRLEIFFPRGELDVLPAPNAVFSWDDKSGRFERRDDWLPDNNELSLATDFADFNGDGWLDIVVANFASGPRLYLSGESLPSDRPGYRSLRPFGDERVYAVEVANLNGDDIPDIAMAAFDREASDMAYLLQGFTIPEGDPIFQSVMLGGSDIRSRAIIALDINDDNLPEIVTSGRDQTRLYINQGDNDFQEATSEYFLPEAFYTGATSCYGLASADMNGDQLPDLFFARDNQDWLFYGEGRPSSLNFTRQQGRPEGPEIFPNPATDQIRISYRLERDSEVSIELIDQRGRRLHSIALGYQAAGAFQRNIGIQQLGLPSGVYLLVLRSTDSSAASPILVLDR